MKKTLFFRKRLDNPNGLVKDNSNATTKTADQPPKIPWYLRFTESFDPRGFAQVAGVGTLYGLLFAGLLLAPLPRMEAQPYGGTGATSSSTDCSPPPSFDFRWMDDYMDEAAKKEIFCALWNGQAITVTFVIEMPWYLFNDDRPRPSRGSDIVNVNPVGYINREFASWEDLNGTGYKMKDLANAIRNFEKKADRLVDARRACGAVCLSGYGAAALACLEYVHPKAILICEGVAAAAAIACALVCRTNWNVAIGDLRDDLEDKIRALTS